MESNVRTESRILFPWEQTTLVYREEILFFLVFLFWTYLAGFHPAAHGTEKYMDFGFMQSMMRSTTLPAQDMWFAGKPFNYYYGGQYLAVFLTKLTGTSVEVTYNLMRTMVAAFAFLLPFSLVRQMLKDKLRTGRKWSFRSWRYSGRDGGVHEWKSPLYYLWDHPQTAENKNRLLVSKLYPLYWLSIRL